MLGRPVGAALLIAAAILAFWRSAPAFAAASPPVADPAATVIWANLFDRQASLHAVERLAIAKQADIVAFGEYPERPVLSSEFQAAYPHRFPAQTDESPNTIIFSRRPIVEAKLLKGFRRSPLVAEIEMARRNAAHRSPSRLGSVDAGHARAPARTDPSNRRGDDIGAFAAYRRFQRRSVERGA